MDTQPSDNESLNLINPLENSTEEAARIQRRNWIIITFINLSGVHMGYYLVLFNMIGSIIVVGVYGYSEEEKISIVSNINMCFSIGGLAGVLTSGNLSERFGRKTMTLAYDIIILLVIVLYTVKQINVLYLARFISGFVSTGGNNLSNVMTAEMLPKSINGVANALNQTTLLLFIFISYMIGFIFSDEFIVDHWRLILTWTGLINVVKIIGILCLVKYDSPKFYLNRNYRSVNRDEKLVEIYMLTHTKKEANERMLDIVKAYEIENKNADKRSTIEKFIFLFSKTMRKRLVAGSLTSAAQEMSGNSFFEIYSRDMFDRVCNVGKTFTLFMAISKLVGSVMIVIFTKYFGRKKNLMVGTLTQSVGLITILGGIWMSHSMLLFIGVFLYMVGYHTGSGGTMYMFIAEILPPVGVSFATAIHWILGILTVKFVPSLAVFYSESTIIIFYAVVCIVIFILMDFYIIETKEKTDVDIIEQYQNREYKFMDFS